MRVAAVYDMHGNLPALEAVIRDVRRAGVDRIVVGGDVLPGPMPRETIDFLLGLDIPVEFISGNGDRETLAWRRGNESAIVPEAFREAMRWCGRELRTSDEQLIESWPKTLRIAVSGIGEVLFCHATPRNDTEIFTRATAEERLVPIFDGLGAVLAVCG